jgi:Mn2+/Fe2+ NRAMP family transporter
MQQMGLMPTSIRYFKLERAQVVRQSIKQHSCAAVGVLMILVMAPPLLFASILAASACPFNNKIYLCASKNWRKDWHLFSLGWHTSSR